MSQTAWSEDVATDVTASFLGITTPLKDLYAEIAKQGWELQKVESPKKDGLFEATASSPHGEKQKAEGRTAVDAVAALLMRVMRTNFMRAGSVRLGMWQSTWTDKLAEVAQAYAKAPVYDPKATGAWVELAQDSVRRAQILQTQLKIEVVDNPEPYPTPQEMCEDIHKNKHFYVSRANTHHPVWSVDQNVAFRIVHDVLGHCVSGGDFGWQGENAACAAHFPLLSANAQKALFTECIAQTAYTVYYRSFGPQKVAFLDEYLSPAQDQENPPGHTGVHPSQSVAPVATPQVAPSVSDDEASPYQDGYVAPHMEGLGLTPVMTRTAAVGQDPNAGWQSGVDPLPNNAFQWQGDPLEAHTEGGMMDTAAKVDTGWHGHANTDGSQDFETAKQAIINAFRVVLLSPRKDLKWNAVHYQHIMNVPPEVDDPKRYWDTLEQQRESWNQARGHAPGSHKPYWKAERDFTAYVRATNSHLSEPEARELAAREWRHIWDDEEERIAADPKNAKLSADEVERKVAKDIERRVLTILKPTPNEKTDVPAEQMNMFAGVNPGQYDLEGNEAGKYGAWMGTHLKAIAQISSNADAITQAALEDVQSHDATGHHFRATVLSLGIPGVGPKVCSFAWLLLQPLTSQLATIDTHMMDVLGHDYDKEMNNRDYFKFERELGTGRDAAGYGHVPLGAFQWGMWDNKRSGPGSHQDHSAMRVLDPVPHDLIDWNDKATNLKGEDWAKQAPQWWQDTEPARQQTGEEWDRTVAPRFPSASVPFQQQSLEPVMAAADGEDDEFCVAFQIPHDVKNTIANWAAQLQWPEDYEPSDPEEYHCTLLYAHSGWHDERNHEWISKYPLRNIPMDAWKLELFGPEQDTVVLRLKTEIGSQWGNRLMDEAEARGMDVSRFPGGYKPHISLGKASALPKGEPLRLHFRSGPLFLYDPRPLQADVEVLRQAIASVARSPWFFNNNGEMVEGEPDQSLMHHLRTNLGLSTPEVWALDPEGGKR